MISSLKVLGAFCLLCTLFPACKKSGDDSGPARYMIVYASPGAPAADVLVENQKVNTSPLNYSDNTGYLDIVSGGRNFKLTEAGTTIAIAETQFIIPPNINFSIFFYDNPGVIKNFAVLDDLNLSQGGKAFLRFFHLSPGGPTLDVGTISGGSFIKLFTNRSFETAFSTDTTRKFIAVDAGNYEFDFRITSVAISVLKVNNVNLEVGKIYTIFVKGAFSSTNPPPDLEIIQHN